MKKDQKGFSTVVILTIVAVVAVAGFVAYRVMTANNPNNQPDNTSQDTTTEEAKAPEVAKHIDVKEWKVKITFDDADKVEYAAPTFGADVSSLSLSLKPEVTSIEECKSLVGFTRHNTSQNETDKKVGDYYFNVTGSPYRCEDGGTGVEELRIKIIQDQLGAGKYTVEAY